MNRYLFFTIFFLANTFLCIASGLPHDWHVSVTSQSKKVCVGEVIQVRLECSYPSQYTPQIEPFLKTIDMYDFDVLSHQVVEEKKRGQCTVIFDLTPKRVQSLVWAPGVLTFTSKENEQEISLLIDPFSIYCDPSGIFVVPERLLPLYPERVVAISSENRIQAFDDAKMLEQEKKYNKALYEEHEKAWTTFAVLLLSCIVLPVSLWILVQYDILSRRLKVKK